ncbi:MAG: dihydrofolate reductase [Gammaproteobacteria bacterium]
MFLSIIVAMDEQNVIGTDGGLPWQLSADLQNFKKITMGKPVIMGRKTHESIGRSLPGRDNVVITRQQDYSSPGCIVCHSIEQVMTRYAGHQELMIMGGAELYRQTIDDARRLYLTRVHASVAGDTRFPDYDPSEWNEIHRQEFPRDERNEYAFSYLILEKDPLVGKAR